MRHMWRMGLIAGALATTAPALAEQGTVGDLVLLGLARDVGWPDGYAYVLVCNLEPGATLTVRASPGRGAVVARLARFVTVEVDTSQAGADWVRVVSADESYTTAGKRKPFKSVVADGWADSAHLCAFEER